MKIKRLLVAAACCAVLAGSQLAGSGCMVKTHACTLVGCVDQATVELQSPAGAWMAGNYRLSVDIAGTQASCALQVPDSPSPTSAIDAQCTSGVTLTFQADMQCMAGPSSSGSGPNGSQSEVCTPVPGHFHQTLTVPGTPAHVALTMTRDGHSLIVTSVALSYQTSQPNGPECDPTCHQASAQLSVGPESDAGASADAGG